MQKLPKIDYNYFIGMGRNSTFTDVQINFLWDFFGERFDFLSQGEGEKQKKTCGGHIVDCKKPYCNGCFKSCPDCICYALPPKVDSEETTHINHVGKVNEMVATPKDDDSWEEKLRNKYQDILQLSNLDFKDIEHFDIRIRVLIQASWSLLSKFKEQGRKEERDKWREIAKNKMKILWSDDSSQHIRNIQNNETLSEILKEIDI